MPAAARKRPAAKVTKAPKSKPCAVCDGSGEVASTVRVGRRRRTVGHQAGLCLACLGSGEATD